jgi:predicted small metal-binding protein
MRKFKCADIGKECSWTTTAANDAKILIQAFHHTLEMIGLKLTKFKPAPLIPTK